MFGNHTSAADVRFLLFVVVATVAILPVLRLVLFLPLSFAVVVVLEHGGVARD
jgi:predicted membrane channel-forming protein YqfA (hemolysin III family)